jgi:DNA-binding transcriptional LysR family regulator
MPTSLVEVRLLEHALAVADEGSFAKGAQLLGISQPALSRSIQALEAQLEIQLFERGHRRIDPTDAGQVFLQRARDIVARHQDLSREMGLVQQNNHRVLTLAAGPYVADLIAGMALARMVASSAAVQLQLRVTSWAQAVKLVRASEADLGVADISLIDGDPELEVTPLQNLQGYLVVRQGHPLLKKRTHRLEEVLTYPLVSTARLPPRLLAPLQQRGPTTNGKKGAFPAILCEQVSVMRAIVAQSDAVGMFTLPLIERELTDGSLVPLACDLPWLHTQFGIFRLRKRPQTADGQQLVACIQQAAADLVAKDQELARPRHRRSG